MHAKSMPHDGADLHLKAAIGPILAIQARGFDVDEICQLQCPTYAAL